MKRKNVIEWDELFMGIAELASKRSKDPDTQCGACIVNQQFRVMSIGYNGLPYGLDDDGFDFRLENKPEFEPNVEGTTTYDYWMKPDKYQFSVHAEQNAILNCNQDLTGCRIYVFTSKGYYPCSRCAQDIIQKGIDEVIMPFAIKDNTPAYDWRFTKHMFKKAGVQIRILREEE